ncbi:MAG TPA: hypothetical protein VD833_12350 [Vicinamibacterales bacterium]|nr:hypothetical protein [Vicinamibacterales bacterium]
MPWILQDIVVTSVACGALLLLVRRVAGVVRPKTEKEGCPACASCSAPRRQAPPDPLIQIARRH